MNDLEKFYNIIKVEGTFSCVNYMTDKNIFSRNHFIDNYEELFKFSKENRYKNCYINYQPLIKPINRKTDNVYGINLIALDIEFIEKKAPETDIRMKELKGYINRLIKIDNIKNYMLVNSGNGYHLYIPLKKLIIGDEYVMKEAYKGIVNILNNKLCTISNNLIKSDDRKDLAGILRIPFTTNTKANKTVKLESIKVNSGDNNYLYLEMKKCMRMADKKKEKFLELEKIHNSKFKNVKLPKNIDELIEHPLVKFLFDKELKDPVVGSRHTSVIFALQALIYHSELYKNPNIIDLSREINRVCGISVDLSTCSYVDNLIYPLKTAIKYFKDNGYIEYKDKLSKMYNL